MHANVIMKQTNEMNKTNTKLRNKLQIAKQNNELHLPLSSQQKKREDIFRPRPARSGK